MIHIHIGGAGIKIGDMLWRLYNIEQADMDCKEQIYYETQNGYMPRAIFTDLDKEILTQSLKDQNYITEFGNDESKGTHSSGVREGLKIKDRLLDKISKFAEGCDKVNEFIFTCAISGGTGSGYTDLVSQNLSYDYPKQSKQVFCIFPSPQMNNNILYTYNTILAFTSFMEYFNAKVFFDNQGMYKMLDANVELDMMNYTHLNNLVSQTISSYTSIPRFNKKSNLEIFNTLIPHPRLSILTPSHCPLVCTNDYKRSLYTFHQMQKQIFSSDAQLLYNVSKTNYIQSSLISRGLNQDIFLKQSNKLFHKIQTFGYDTNLFISNSKNYQVIEELAPLPLTNTLFANDSSIVTRLNQIRCQFDKLTQAEHHDFDYGKNSIKDVIESYQEVMQQNFSNNGEEASNQASEPDEI